MGRHESVWLNIYSRAVSSAEAYPLTSTTLGWPSSTSVSIWHENHQPSNCSRASARVTPPSGAPGGVSASRATSATQHQSRLVRRRAGVKDSTVRANGSSERRLREHRTHVFRWFDAVLQIRRASFFPIHVLQFNCTTRRFGDETSVCSRGALLITQVKSENNDLEYYSGHICRSRKTAQNKPNLRLCHIAIWKLK